MPKKLVIVESPAKAKTIKQFLGSDYTVEASIGHIRDLPDNKKGLPEKFRKMWWADYAVDVDNGFKPFYVVPQEKQKVVAKLKEALKGSAELVLATDEDREGESISWHLIEVLSPGKDVAIHRIAFHEITREAIEEALASPRDIDRKLVEAQETRRILDRLYGYTLSPVLWTKVAKELSAGRVQSPAVKLIVERAKRRREFVAAAYWDIKAELESAGTPFSAAIKSYGEKPIASGKDFDELTGKLKNDKPLWLDEAAATRLVENGQKAKPWRVTSVNKTPGQEKPPPPFRTTTLQQEANRKFGYSADRTMRIAQDLYEGVDLHGTRVGLITYMRTDSLALANAAVKEAREVIQEQFGAENVPAKPNRYASKVANAQEAHEAVRPTSFRRTPESIRDDLLELGEAHFKLYELVYRRTLACQMKPAEVLRTNAKIKAEIDGKIAEFEATGKEFKFPGFHLAYVEDVDDPEEELESKEKILPNLQEGQEVKLIRIESQGKETKPPPRYTDASLIKALEELGIGRPSTYATILSVIEDRGYVVKERRELIATWMAFLAMEVLEGHFQEFMDLKFTAAMDDTLDAIAEGKDNSKQYLQRFFLGGNGTIGLKKAVDERKKTIPFPAIEVGKHPETGERILIRLSKGDRPYLQLGDKVNKKYASIPDELYPEDVNVSKAVELLAAEREAPKVVGIHPQTGRNLLLKKRGNFYLEVERTPEEVEKKLKPTWVSLPADVDPASLTQADFDYLSSMPKEIGKNPETGDSILFRLGRYGPYIQSGKEMRSVADWKAGLTMSVADAMELLKMPKQAASHRARRTSEPIKDFGQLPGAEGPVRVLRGRYGPYVSDGKVNATIPKGTDPASVTPELAMELIQARIAAGPSKRRPFRRGRSKSAA